MTIQNMGKSAPTCISAIDPQPTKLKYGKTLWPDRYTNDSNAVSAGGCPWSMATASQGRQGSAAGREHTEASRNTGRGLPLAYTRSYRINGSYATVHDEELGSMP